MSINAQYYRSVLEHNLRTALRAKRRNFLNNPPIILHDNARAHSLQTVADVFARWDWEVPFQSPYSLDLRLCDFDLIPNIKGSLCAIRFHILSEIL